MLVKAVKILIDFTRRSGPTEAGEAGKGKVWVDG